MCSVINDAFNAHLVMLVYMEVSPTIFDSIYFQVSIRGVLDCILYACLLLANSVL